MTSHCYWGLMILLCRGGIGIKSENTLKATNLGNIFGTVVVNAVFFFRCQIWLKPTFHTIAVWSTPLEYTKGDPWTLNKPPE